MIKKRIATKAVTGIMFSVCMCLLFMTGCGNGAESQSTNTVNEQKTDIDIENTAENTEDPAAEAEPVSENNDIAEDAEPADERNEAAEEADEEKAKSGDKFEIVWLGDSLTQGSLGEDNNNENNPQAPWRVLKELSGRRVAGLGLYGCTAHDIFWLYDEYKGIKDPDVIYVYWVGSNDFFRSPDNVTNVIEETDRFNESGGITKFVMLGTTDRHDMDPDAHIGINKALEERYGDKYLDILPYVEYGPDGVHLTVESYAAIAAAVNDKINELYKLD